MTLAIRDAYYRRAMEGWQCINADEFFRRFGVNSPLTQVDRSIAPAGNPIYNLPSGYRGTCEIRPGLGILF